MTPARALLVGLVFASLSALGLDPSALAGEPASGEAAASAPAASSTPLDPAYVEARKVAKSAKRRADGDPLGSFARSGCMNDPSKCTCQSENAQESAACGDVLGYFCPDSTMKLLASSCMDLFGGATVCKCASNQQIATHIKSEEDAAAKAAKAAAKKKKSGSSKKKAPAK
ncbi:MAG: hypothetical protein H6710_06485 [Myxococcales bacterium]|nr:hypothetical protein [Myxococcales bacterium]MCB9704585.1 hypothetical protein [Myxococcales bacterium]